MSISPLFFLSSYINPNTSINFNITTSPLFIVRNFRNCTNDTTWIFFFFFFGHNTYCTIRSRTYWPTNIISSNFTILVKINKSTTRNCNRSFAIISFTNIKTKSIRTILMQEYKISMRKCPAVFFQYKAWLCRRGLLFCPWAYPRAGAIHFPPRKRLRTS